MSNARAARKNVAVQTGLVAATPWLVLTLMVTGDSPQRAYYLGGHGVSALLIAATMTLAGVTAIHALTRDVTEDISDRRRATLILPIVLFLIPPLLILVAAPLPAHLSAP